MGQAQSQLIGLGISGSSSGRSPGGTSPSGKSSTPAPFGQKATGSGGGIVWNIPTTSPGAGKP